MGVIVHVLYLYTEEQVRAIKKHSKEELVVSNMDCEDWLAGWRPMLFPMQATLGQDTTDYLHLPIVPPRADWQLNLCINTACTLMTSTPNDGFRDSTLKWQTLTSYWHSWSPDKISLLFELWNNVPSPFVDLFSFKCKLPNVRKNPLLPLFVFLFSKKICDEYFK
jgi:hypothetical protein